MPKDQKKPPPEQAKAGANSKLRTAKEQRATDKKRIKLEGEQACQPEVASKICADDGVEVIEAPGASVSAIGLNAAAFSGETNEDDSVQVLGTKNSVRLPHVSSSYNIICEIILAVKGFQSLVLQAISD